MLVHGQCHCGAIAYEAEVDPATVRICHCTDCQTMSGSLFRANIQTDGSGFRLLRGTPKIYVTTADSGNKRAQAFCADCGTGMWATSPDNPSSYGLRVGTLTERGEFRPARQIWCDSALPWIGDVSALGKRPRQ